MSYFMPLNSFHHDTSYVYVTRAQYCLVLSF